MLQVLLGDYMSLNNEYNKARFEYNIASTLNQYTRFDAINCRDICKFDPYMFVSFLNDYGVDSLDSSMAADGIYHCGTDELGRKYFIDSNSGLVLLQEGSKFSIAKHACTSKHYDIFDAAYLRNYIVSPEKINKRIFVGGIGEITTLDYLGLQIDEVFSTPILEYTVSTRNELNELILYITSRLSDSKFFRKLWFRGQRREYEHTITKSVINRIGFPDEFSKMPSLIPSAGRLSDIDEYNDTRKQIIYWNQAFKIWLLSQSDGVPSDFKVDGAMYKEMLRSLEPTKMIEFLRNNPYDIDEYVFEQHSEPMWSSVLSAQQYGACTSMLDITDDIDVALFFTQSYLNKNTRKFELCEPNSSNVIYIMAETRGSGTINFSDKIFDGIHYDGTFIVPPRISNQCCGLLKGADMLSKNTYAYRILVKIKMTGDGIKTTKTIDEMFPGMDVDSLYKTFSYAEPKLKGLYG